MFLVFKYFFYTFVLLKPKPMNKLNFHDFYNYLWQDEILEIVIPNSYLDKNDEFIKNLSLDLFRFYELSDIPPQYIKKLVELFFTNTFIFKPKI